MSGSNAYLTRSNSASSEVNDYYKHKFSPGQPELFDDWEFFDWLPFSFDGTEIPSSEDTIDSSVSIQLKTPISVQAGIISSGSMS